jgi:hypothetical protein
MVPRLLQVDGFGHAFQLLDDKVNIDQGNQVQFGDQAFELFHFLSKIQHVVARIVRLEIGHSEFSAKFVHPVLSRPDPLPTQIKVKFLGEMLGMYPTAYAVAGLEYLERKAFFVKQLRRGNARKPAADDDGIKHGIRIFG